MMRQHLCSGYYQRVEELYTANLTTAPVHNGQTGAHEHASADTQPVKVERVPVVAE